MNRKVVEFLLITGILLMSVSIVVFGVRTLKATTSQNEETIINPENWWVKKLPAIQYSGVYVVKIDGKEYVVISDSRGTAICPK